MARKTKAKKAGRPRWKYRSAREAYLARLADNRRWRAANPEKFAKIQAASYRKRRARALSAA